MIPTTRAHSPGDWRPCSRGLSVQAFPSGLALADCSGYRTRESRPAFVEAAGGPSCLVLLRDRVLRSATPTGRCYASHCALTARAYRSAAPRRPRHHERSIRPAVLRCHVLLVRIGGSGGALRLGQGGMAGYARTQSTAFTGSEVPGRTVRIQPRSQPRRARRSEIAGAQRFYAPAGGACPHAQYARARAARTDRTCGRTVRACPAMPG